MSATVFPEYRIFTDATADLSFELTLDLPAVEVIPMDVQIGDDLYTYGPNGNLSIDHFYHLQRSGKFASTSQIVPLTYRYYFERALKSGYDILYLCFSSGMSGTINSARMCIDDLQEEYPERKIICIDTLCASAGEGFLVHEAARMQAGGMGIDELVQWVLDHRLQVCHWFTVDTFDHLKHGGRVSATAAVMGNMLNIKPMLHVDEKGSLQLSQKPRGEKQAIRSQLDCMQKGWNPEISNLVVVAHGDNREGASMLANGISDRFPQAKIIATEIGPVIGAHTGPGMLAVIYWGNNR